MSEAAATPAPGQKAPPPVCPYLDPENAPLPKSGWLRRWPWVTVLLPFVIFMLFNMVEPSPPDPKVEAEVAKLTEVVGTGDATERDEAEKQLKKLRDEVGPSPPGPTVESEITRLTKIVGVGNAAERNLAQERLHKIHEELAHKVPYKYYPAIYTAKIAATTLAMLAVIPGYLAFPLRVHWISWVVGAVGGAAWIVLAKFQVSLYPMLPEMFSKVLEMGGRTGFNPLVELKDNPAWAYGFLAIRFFGLVIVVAVIEEFFLRGFLMRYVMDIDWPLIPFGVVNKLALITVLVFPVVYHPERLAAAVWFSLVTWMMLRTRSIGDCIVAHAVTNLIMGLWVVWSGDWWMM